MRRTIVTAAGTSLPSSGTTMPMPPMVMPPMVMESLVIMGIRMGMIMPSRACGRFDRLASVR